MGNKNIFCLFRFTTSQDQNQDGGGGGGLIKNKQEESFIPNACLPALHNLCTRGGGGGGGGGYEMRFDIEIDLNQTNKRQHIVCCGFF